MLSQLVKRLSAIMVESSSLVKAATAMLPEVTLPWQQVNAPCMSEDKRQLLRDGFAHSVTVPTVRIEKERIRTLTKLLRPILLEIQRIKVVDDPNDNTKKLILLDPKKLKRYQEILSDAAKLNLKEEGVSLPPTEKYSMNVTYDMYSWDDAIQILLPEDLKFGGFTVTGHIAHINFKDELLPFKYVIAQIVLDKVHSVRTVVNKVHSIDNTFRNFQMELLAGEEDFIATAKENGCTFKMDFSKVYWNSRLSTEHDRIVNQLSNFDVLYDMFAGIGPFAIPAAAKRCEVFASDLNPESYEWLKRNVMDNDSKRRRFSIKCYNLDAREFFRDVVRADYQRRLTDPEDVGNAKFFIVMNLPGLAVQFLDVFRELVDSDFVEQKLDGDWSKLRPVNVRCYCFLREEKVPRETEADNRLDVHDMTRSTVESAALQILGLKAFESLNVRFVRNVAVSKNMYCLEFPLTSDHFAELCAKAKGGDCEQPPKRLRLSSNEN